MVEPTPPNATGSRHLDDLVIVIAVGGGLLIALGLWLVTALYKVDCPPTLISTFLGIAIAALTYRFLGGAGGTQFSVGVLKLGGSAALLLGTVWFVGNRLRDDQRLTVTTAQFRADNDTLRNQVSADELVLAQRDQLISTLRAKLSATPDAQRLFTIDEIKKMHADDPFIRDLKGLVAGEEGPFSLIIRDLPVRVAVVAMGDSPQFLVCGDTLGKLNDGISVPQTKVQLSRAVGEEAQTESIVAERAGKIARDFCDKPGREFDVQINCPVALKLFSDVIKSCADGRKVRGQTATIGALAE